MFSGNLFGRGPGHPGGKRCYARHWLPLPQLARLPQRQHFPRPSFSPRAVADTAAVMAVVMAAMARTTEAVIIFVAEATAAGRTTAATVCGGPDTVGDGSASDQSVCRGDAPRRPAATGSHAGRGRGSASPLQTPFQSLCILLPTLHINVGAFQDHVRGFLIDATHRARGRAHDQ
jgi:hypothetical protein